MPEAVRDVLTEILRDDLQVDTDRIERDSRLIDDVGLDSVAFAVGMVAIEERLGVTLTERELLTCDTVGLDSVAFAVGMVAIEERLGVTLTERELLTCDTVGDLEDIVTDKAAKVGQE